VITWPVLIAALITVESSDGLNTVGDQGKARGVLQLHQVYVRDCNIILQSMGSSFRYEYADRDKEPHSVGMALLYLRHYCRQYEKDTGKKATMEIAARIHNGGPTGWKKKSTEKYWKKVELALEGKK